MGHYRSELGLGYDKPKVFVVPKVLGTGAIGNPGKPCCALGHIYSQCGIGPAEMFPTFVLAKQLSIPRAAITELTDENDATYDLAERRQKMIDWLKKYNIPYVLEEDVTNENN